MQLSNSFSSFLLVILFIRPFSVIWVTSLYSLKTVGSVLHCPLLHSFTSAYITHPVSNSWIFQLTRRDLFLHSFSQPSTLTRLLIPSHGHSLDLAISSSLSTNHPLFPSSYCPHLTFSSLSNEIFKSCLHSLSPPPVSYPHFKFLIS